MNDNENDNKKDRAAYPADMNTQLLLSAYLDDALPETERKAFADSLAHNPALRAQYDACRADREWLRDALAPLAAETPPPHVSQMLHGNRRAPMAFRPRMAVAALVLCLVSAALGWLAGVYSHKASHNSVGVVSIGQTAASNAALQNGARDMVKTVAEHETAGIEGMTTAPAVPAADAALNVTTPPVVNDAALVPLAGPGPLPETTEH